MDREHLQGAGFAENELSEFNGEALPSWCRDPATSSADRIANAARGIVPDTKLTAAEEAYFASRGANITGIFRDYGRDVAADGTIGYTTYDGRVLSGADYVNGFALGDVVQLKVGGPRMVVVDWASKGVRCEWFVDRKRFSEDFRSAALKYLGPLEDLPPEQRVITLNERRWILRRRGMQSIATKPKRVPKLLLRRDA